MKKAVQSHGKGPRKAYSKPKLVTHGDVAKLTKKHPKLHKHGNGPESDIG